MLKMHFHLIFLPEKFGAYWDLYYFCSVIAK